jgi:hypothetical protein
MTFVPSAKLPVPSDNIFFDMFLVSACLAGRLAEICQLSVGYGGVRGQNRPCAKSQAWAACRSKVGTAGCSIRKIDSRRHIIHTNPNDARVANNGLTASNKRLRHANPGNDTCGALIWGIGEATAALHHALEARPQSLVYPPAVVPTFGLLLPPLFLALLGREWVQTECEVIAKMPSLVPIER